MNTKLSAPILFMFLVFSVLAISVIISGQGTSFSFGHYAEDIAGGIFGGNISSSENYSFAGRVGIDTNSPTESLDVNGTVRVRDNVYIDKQSDYLFDSSGVIKEKFLPYCSEEITSDVYTNGQDQSTGCNFGGYSGYYNITNLVPSNVKSGVVFGRGETGTLAPSGTATESDVCNSKTFYSGNSWTQKTGTRTACQSCSIGTAVASNIERGKTADIDCDGVAESGTLGPDKPSSSWPSSTTSFAWFWNTNYVEIGGKRVCGSDANKFCECLGLTYYGRLSGDEPIYSSCYCYHINSDCTIASTSSYHQGYCYLYRPICVP